MPNSNRSVLLLVVLLLSLAVRTDAETVVNDITKLNPISVAKVVTPRSVEEIQKLVKENAGPISIGGGRFSMGGQIATENALFLDMREMNRILQLSVEKKLITVEAGITWRKIQEEIDPKDLSLKIMQSYANFTVGGSLSVNVHGRYVGQGPLIKSVRSMKVVLANGTLVEASPQKNAEIFYGCIGGYGGLGVIVEATLELADNVRMEREVTKMRVDEYAKYFAERVKPSPTVIFHNGDIYPPKYENVLAISFSKTDREVTETTRMMPVKESYALERWVGWMVSELPGGKWLREKVLDPIRLRGNPVYWRNFEASYDVKVLEPKSRDESTYVLQEYFVPVGRFDEFAKKMAEIFTRFDANIINVSIRHAEKDPGALLAWAREEVFAFVVYYKQGTKDYEKGEVAIWTRELIDAALAVNGTYYLPYQIHAREDQFHRGYPRAKEYFQLKARLDPTYKFRNKLWDHYYQPASRKSASTEPAKALDGGNGYVRSEEQTFLTLPEWYIVYSADEFSEHLKKSRPSDFPYFGSIGQFWRLYASVFKKTTSEYSFNVGYNFMISVIGVSFTAEYLLKGLYEKTIGCLVERMSSPTEQDRFAEKTALEYATFIHSIPWYEFPFGQKLAEFHRLKNPPGESGLRKWERKVFYSMELSFKTIWSWMIKGGTKASYTPQDLEIKAFIVEKGETSARLVTIPRYEPFKAAVIDVTTKGGRFVEIAGNKKILATLITPAEWQSRGETLLEWPILTDRSKKRVAIALSIPDLHETLPQFRKENLILDHLYDF